MADMVYMLQAGNCSVVPLLVSRFSSAKYLSNPLRHLSKIDTADMRVNLQVVVASGYWLESPRM